MTERIINLVLDESKWLSTAMFLAFLTVVMVVGRQRHQDLALQARLLSALHLFYGCMIGIMASGHLLAVTVKVFQGTLEGSPWFLYPLGLALALPAWWLAAVAWRLPHGRERLGKTALALNVWLAICLLALGPQNLPLAAPAALNIGYHFHSRPAVGWSLVTVATVGYLALFVGSLIFFASGQSFEEFKGLE